MGLSRLRWAVRGLVLSMRQVRQALSEWYGSLLSCGLRITEQGDWVVRGYL